MTAEGEVYEALIEIFRDVLNRFDLDPEPNLTPRNGLGCGPFK